jgi:hypothetical protein
MTLLDQILLLATGLVSIYLIWRFYGAYSKTKHIYDIYYMISFAVLLISGVLLIFLGWDILSSPYVLTVTSLMPLGISLGLVMQFLPKYGKLYTWFAAIGLVLIAATSIGGMSIKSAIVPIFHGVAGLIIVVLPIYLAFFKKNEPGGFSLVSLGGLLISIGGMALAFLNAGKPLFGFMTGEVILAILAPLLLLMALCFTWGFVKDIKSR